MLNLKMNRQSRHRIQVDRIHRQNLVGIHRQIQVEIVGQPVVVNVQHEHSREAQQLFKQLKRKQMAKLCNHK